jgi:hypothetical protein
MGFLKVCKGCATNFDGDFAMLLIVTGLKKKRKEHFNYRL